MPVAFIIAILLALNLINLEPVLAALEMSLSKAVTITRLAVVNLVIPVVVASPRSPAIAPAAGARRHALNNHSSSS